MVFARATSSRGHSGFKPDIMRKLLASLVAPLLRWTSLLGRWKKSKQHWLDVQPMGFPQLTNDPLLMLFVRLFVILCDCPSFLCRYATGSYQIHTIRLNQNTPTSWAVLQSAIGHPLVARHGDKCLSFGCLIPRTCVLILDHCRGSKRCCPCDGSKRRR